MITSITIGNFKGIGHEVTVPLRPITLLFGKNSAGKSTILQAVLYALEVIRTGNADIDTVQLGGDSIHLGGFRNVVHKHDTSRTIRLRIDIFSEYEFADVTCPDFELLDELELPEDHDCAGESFASFDCDMASMYGYYFELEIAYNPSTKGAVVIRFTCGDVTDDGETTTRIADITYAPGSKQAFFTRIAKSYVLSGLDLSREQYQNDYGFDLLQYLYNHFPYGGSDNVYEASIPFVADKYGALPLGFSTFSFPTLTDANSPEDPDSVLAGRAFEHLLSVRILKPLELARRILLGTRYIGPIREIPQRNHEPQTALDESRWANGFAAWDELLRSRADGEDSEGLIGEVNHALQETLNLDCSVERVDMVDLDAHGDLMAKLSLLATSFEDTDPDEAAQLIAELQNLNTTPRLFLRDSVNDVRLAPRDVGVGVSQVLPVVVGALADAPNTALGSVLAVEQPELHVHPAVQCNLGDVFIQAIRKDGKTLLIETHSEHLLLRLLRRVRESEDAPAPALTPDQLSVIYVRPTEEGVELTPLAVNEEGDFDTEWPEGFFEERGEELF